jgi:hypothetical protein
MRVFVALVCLVLVIAAAPLAAQDATCMQQMAESFQSTLDSCPEIVGDNQICLGGGSVQTVSWPGASDLGLREAGDRASVANLQELIVGNPSYGTAVMKLHPNLGGTINNQGLTLVVYGSVRVQATAPSVLPTPTPLPTITPVIAVFTTLTNVNKRSNPDLNGVVVGSLRKGEQGLVLGRSTDGLWFYVDTGIPYKGWVWGESLRIDGDINALPVSDSDYLLNGYKEDKPNTSVPIWQKQIAGAMRNLVVQTSVASSPCSDAPSGILIHSDNNASPQELRLNGMYFLIDGTMNVQAPPGGPLLVRVLAGTVEVAPAERYALVKAGTQFVVPLNPDGIILRRMSSLVPLGTAGLDMIPLGLLPEYVPLPEPMDTGELDDSDLFPQSGLYQIRGMYTTAGCLDRYAGETQEIVPEQVRVSVLDNHIVIDALDRRGLLDISHSWNRVGGFLSSVSLQAGVADENGVQTTHPSRGVYMTTYPSMTDETNLISPTRIEGYRISSSDTCTQQWDYALEYVGPCERLAMVETDLYQCVNAP